MNKCCSKRYDIPVEELDNRRIYWYPYLNYKDLFFNFKICSFINTEYSFDPILGMSLDYAKTHYINYIFAQNGLFYIDVEQLYNDKENRSVYLRPPPGIITSDKMYMSLLMNFSYEEIKELIHTLDYESLLENKHLDPEKVKLIYEQYGQFQ